MQLWLGIITFVGGAVLWYVSNRERALVPPWVPRLAVGVTALGLSTLAATQPATAWKVVSIALSLVAITLILTVLRDNLRRR
jgi:predicted lysophospholipase L1 biosynthesis ABC-type transport system permease subunit